MALVHRAVGGDRARVGEPPDAETTRGLENVDRPDDVDFRPGDRVGLAERNLQRREMNDRARPHGFQGPHDGLEVGNIAGAPPDFFEFALLGEQARPPLVLVQIERARRDSGPGEEGEHPAADAAAGARDEHGTGKVRAID